MAWKDTAKSIGVRAAKTFLQTFLAVITASAVGTIDLSVVKTAAIAGGAAVLSLLQNLLANSEVKQAQVAADKAYRSRQS